jgi:hypothetical protein
MPAPTVQRSIMRRKPSPRGRVSSSVANGVMPGLIVLTRVPRLPRAMRRDGMIGNEAFQRLEEELDLADLALATRILRLPPQYLRGHPYPVPFGQPQNRS